MRESGDETSRARILPITRYFLASRVEESERRACAADSGFDSNRMSPICDNRVFAADNRPAIHLIISRTIRSFRHYVQSVSRNAPIRLRRLKDFFRC